MNESNIQQNQQNAGKSGDEIDIFDFTSRIWKSFKSFLTETKDLIISFIIYSIRKTLWIVSFAVLGMILGFVYYSVKKPYYTSLLEGTSGGVDNTVVIDHINTLFQMVKKPELLARSLKLTEEQAEQIRSIKALYGIDVNKDGKPDYIDEFEKYDPRKDTSQRVPSTFYIKVALYDEEILDTLRKSLFDYINRNTYIQTLYEIDKRQKKEMIAELTKEIIKIDSVQYLDLARKTNKKKNYDKAETVFVFGNEPEIKLFYTDIFKLYEQKQALQKSLEISDKPVVIVQDFTPSHHEEKTVAYYMIRLGLAMAVLGYFCAILWQYRKPLWKIIKEEEPTN